MKQVPALLIGGFVFSLVAVFMMKSTLNGIAAINKLNLPVHFLGLIAVFGLGILSIFCSRNSWYWDEAPSEYFVGPL